MVDGPGLKPVVNGFVKPWGTAFKNSGVFFESLTPPDLVGSEDAWKTGERLHEATSALAAKKNFVVQKLRWNHMFKRLIWRGVRRDQHFPLHSADTRRIQYWSYPLLVDGLVLKSTRGLCLKRVVLGCSSRATSAKSKDFVKPCGTAFKTRSVESPWSSPRWPLQGEWSWQGKAGN